MKLLIFDQAMTEQVYAGRKTMVRVYMERQPSMQSQTNYAQVYEDRLRDDRGKFYIFPYKTTIPLREWWRKTEYGFEYKTDRNDLEAKDWQSPAMMPIRAARVWLDITEVYIERFSEISGTEFDAEGIKPGKQIVDMMYWNYLTNRYSAKTKQESIQSYYMSKIPTLDLREWGWVIHFQHATSL